MSGTRDRQLDELKDCISDLDYLVRNDALNRTECNKTIQRVIRNLKGLWKELGGE